MAVGYPTKNNWIAGDVLTASAMDDLGSTVNYTQYHTPRNVVLNSAFDIWQRATSFASPATNNLLCDRWRLLFDGSGATRTISQQTFTPGTAPVSGQEYPYFFRWAQTVAGTGGLFNRLVNLIEDARTFAGQTATLSFWAKADTAQTITPSIIQNFGSGGSPSSSVTTAGSAISITTSWARYTQTFAIPSISGKTFGTTANTSQLQISLALPVNAVFTLDLFGVQLEKGQYANEYFRNGTNAAAELAACQRYAYAITPMSIGTNVPITNGFCQTTTVANGYLPFPVTMITSPTINLFNSVTVASYAVISGTGPTATACSSAPTYAYNPNGVLLTFTVASGLTAGQGCYLGSSGLQVTLFFDTGL